MRRSSQSISKRLIVSLSITICLLFFLCFIFISQRNKALIESELEQSISGSIRQAQASLSGALWQFSYEYVDDIVESMFLNEDIVLVASNIFRTFIFGGLSFISAFMKNPFS